MIVPVTLIVLVLFLPARDIGKGKGDQGQSSTLGASKIIRSRYVPSSTNPNYLTLLYVDDDGKNREAKIWVNN